MAHSYEVVKFQIVPQQCPVAFLKACTKEELSNNPSCSSLSGNRRHRKEATKRKLRSKHPSTQTISSNLTASCACLKLHLRCRLSALQPKLFSSAKEVAEDGVRTNLFRGRGGTNEGLEHGVRNSSVANHPKVWVGTWLRKTRAMSLGCVSAWSMRRLEQQVTSIGPRDGGRKTGSEGRGQGIMEEGQGA